MWDTSAAYPTDILEFVPNCCQEAPLYGKAFCETHCNAAAAQGITSNLNEFISVCGANPEALTKDGKGKMKDVLKTMAQNSTFQETISDDQQIGFLLKNPNLATKENFSSTEKAGEDCRKDVGEKTVHKLSKSRGGLFSISGGGVIRSWSTLYKSEGPTQVALLMISFLYMYLSQASIPEKATQL